MKNELHWLLPMMLALASGILVWAVLCAAARSKKAFKDLGPVRLEEIVIRPIVGDEKDVYSIEGRWTNTKGWVKIQASLIPARITIGQLIELLEKSRAEGERRVRKQEDEG